MPAKNYLSSASKKQLLKALQKDLKKEENLQKSNLEKIPLLTWVLLVLTTLIFIIWEVPQLQVKSIPSLQPNDRAILEDKYRGTLLQGIGGLFFFVTAYFTYRNVKIAEETLKTTKDKQISESFSKATDQLLDTKIAIRLTGIFFLEKIAKNSPADHWTVMELLTTLIRESSLLEIEKDKESQHEELASNKGQISRISSDVQAALTVIGRRNPENDNYSESENDHELNWLDLSGANLSGAILSGAILIGAILSGAILSRVQFMNKTDLSGANLSGATLSGATLYESNLGGAYLGKANLSGVNLRDANLGEANLSGANLSGANLSGANLGGAILSGAKNLDNAHIKSACFWDKAIYTQLNWHDDTKAWILEDEQANQKRIEEIRQDTASDPEKPVDCSNW